MTCGRRGTDGTDEPIVLPELLTTDIVLTALEKSGPSQKKRELASGN